MELSLDMTQRLRNMIDRERLVRTVVELVQIPSPTGDAGAVLDHLADMLSREGFSVERPAAGHASAPAVAVRLDSGKPGKMLQFNGHLDTVHLPFVAPAVHADRITGSGSCDMKGGTAAAVEALRALRDSGALSGGRVLFTGHDLHEAPWGDGRQLDALIREGYVGDAVLIPEYLNAVIPVVGRGQAVWKITIRRAGPPIHEVLRPLDEPSVIDAAAELIARLRQYGGFLASKSDPEAGTETVFIGQGPRGERFSIRRRRNASWRGRAAGCRGRRGPKSKPSFPPWLRRPPSARRRRSRCTFKKFATVSGSIGTIGSSIAFKRRTPPPATAALSPSAPNPSSTTAIPFGRWRESPRSRTARPPAGRILCTSGSRSTTSFASRTCTP